MNQISSLIVAFTMFGVIFSVLPSAYSETTEIGEQGTLEGDSLDSPIAQEILKKIEESKRKIAKLQQQNYNSMQAQKFLEDRRAVALERLNQSLALWEEEWYEFSPKVAYQKFIDKMPSDVQGIYSKQFEFTESKHELGMTAKTNALDNGIISYKALEQFNSAARSTVNELNAYNETIQPDTPSEIRTKIAIIQGNIDSSNAGYFYHHAKLKGELNAEYVVEVENERADIKDFIEKYDSNSISREELTIQIGIIREKYAPLKENLLEENTKILAEYEKQYMDSVQDRIYRINNNEDVSPFVEAVWNSEIHSIELVRNR